MGWKRGAGLLAVASALSACSSWEGGNQGGSGGGGGAFTEAGPDRATETGPPEAGGAGLADANADAAVGADADAAGEAAGTTESGADDAELGDGMVQGCTPLEVAYCNDDNDCTLDRCTVAAGCQHEPLADGEPCDDRNACTRADHCEAGACKGEPIGQAPEILGHVDAFGSQFETRDPYFQGLGTILSPELAVFADRVNNGTSLKLVRVSPDGLELLSTAFSYGNIDVVPGVIWSSSFGSHLVPLGPTRVAFVSGHYAIEIYDMIGGALVLKGLRLLSDDGLDSAVISALARGNRLWLCDSSQIAGYSVTDDGELSAPVVLSSPSFCSALGASPDGNTLYLGSQLGIRRIDVSDPASPPIIESTPVFLEPAEHRPLQIEAKDDYLFVQESKAWSGLGDAFVLRASDYSVVASFPSDEKSQFSLGGVWLDSGLLLERLRYATDGSGAQYLAQFYSLDGGSAALQQEWLFATDPYAFVGIATGAQPLGLGSLAVLAPMRHLVDTANGSLRELRGPEQGSLTRVRPGPPGKVLAYGPDSTHLIDISQPTAPVIRAGGLLPTASGDFVRVDLPAASRSAPSLLNVSAFSTVAHETVAQVGFDGSSAPTLKGELMLEGQNTLLASSGGLLFQLTGNVSDTHSLATFVLPRAPETGVMLEANESLALSTSMRSFGVFIADASTHSVLLGGSRGGDGSPALEWLAHERESWSPLDVPALSGSEGPPSAAALAGDLAAVISNNGRRLSLFRRNGAHVNLEVTRDFEAETLVPPYPEISLTRVLGVDGSLLYLAGSETDPVTFLWQPRVLALRLQDLTEAFRYALDDNVQSITFVDNHLVFGLGSSAVVANPGCPNPSLER